MHYWFEPAPGKKICEPQIEKNIIDLRKNFSQTDYWFKR